MLMLMLLGGCSMAQAPAAEPYHPPGMYIWDLWFAESDGVTHAFYLQAARALPDPDLKHGHQHVGHSVSRDLLHWENRGPALVNVYGTWNDLSIATGSICRHAGKWWMLFTGRGSKQSGVGLAVSDDLDHWRKVGDGPVLPFGERYETTWEGEQVSWQALADPYVHPEPIDGWFMMVINSQVDGAPEGRRGCLAALRSRDLQTWEPVGILAWPKWFERMETPQFWQHDGRWYLYFGAHGGLHSYALRAAVPDATRAGNYVLQSAALMGPYEPRGTWWLNLPDGKPGYIYKTVPEADGRVLLTTIDCSMSPPYPITYSDDGSLIINEP